MLRVEDCYRKTIIQIVLRMLLLAKCEFHLWNRMGNNVPGRDYIGKQSLATIKHFFVGVLK